MISEAKVRVNGSLVGRILSMQVIDTRRMIGTPVLEIVFQLPELVPTDRDITFEIMGIQNPHFASPYNSNCEA